MRFATFHAIVLATALSFPASGVLANPGHEHGDAKAGGPGKAAEATRTVKIDSLDQSFSLKQVQVKPGETIRFVVTNKSSIKHEFGIGTHHDQQAHRAMMSSMPDMEHNDPHVVSVKPGETKEVIWKFGTDKEALKDLEFSCNIPGHAEGGMIGSFRSL